MVEPGTLNLNNEVSTVVWEPVGLTFRALFLKGLGRGGESLANFAELVACQL